MHGTSSVVAAEIIKVTYAVLRDHPGKGGEAPRSLIYPGVHSAVEPPRSISNSGVKRGSGNDSWGVAPCENSAMPGKTFPSSVCCARTGVTLQKKPPKRVVFLCLCRGPLEHVGVLPGRERVARSRGCALASKRRCSRWLVSSRAFAVASDSVPSIGHGAMAVEVDLMKLLDNWIDAVFNGWDGIAFAAYDLKIGLACCVQLRFRVADEQDGLGLTSHSVCKKAVAGGVLF